MITPEIAALASRYSIARVSLDGGEVFMHRGVRQFCNIRR
jgi:hypothetical protein